EEATHDRAVRLVANEELLRERAELTAGQIAVDAAGRLSHLLVGEQDRRRIKLRDLLRLGHDPAPALGNERRGPEPRIELVRLRIPLEAVRMADEAALSDLLERAGAVPGPLVVGVENVTFRIEADAARRTHAAGGGD